MPSRFFQSPKLEPLKEDPLASTYKSVSVWICCRAACTIRYLQVALTAMRCWPALLYAEEICYLRMLVQQIDRRWRLTFSFRLYIIFLDASSLFLISTLSLSLFVPVHWTLYIPPLSLCSISSILFLTVCFLLSLIPAPSPPSRTFCWCKSRWQWRRTILRSFKRPWKATLTPPPTKVTTYSENLHVHTCKLPLKYQICYYYLLDFTYFYTYKKHFLNDDHTYTFGKPFFPF